MQTQLRRGKAPARPTREAYFVRVAGPEDGSPQFFNATQHLGRPMPFEKPLATCAMQVKDDLIAFSLLHLTKRTAPSIASAPVSMPRGSLAKLERHSAGYAELGAGEIAVELNEETYRLTVERDENGVATLEQVLPTESEESGEVPADTTFELPRSAVQLTLFLRSPAVGRLVGVTFIGHLGKPGDGIETVPRAAAKVLNSLSQLAEFRILTGIETVNLPPAPNRWAIRAAARRPEEQPIVEVPVWLFSAEFQPLAAGSVVVEVDVENANPSSGRLLCKYAPSEPIAELFPHYRNTFDLQIAAKLRLALGDDDIASITYDIVLGTVDTGTLERLREALGTIAGQDLTPTQVKDHV